ncbi:unnamed protein product [Callosobruchus maculatus]|uniref:Uncharacterized protein n=1 Tax=Callosobruchus maculatus TaxID=64391 RepID=A0A653CGC5_CALMS|nr:unnamed protein product [Callosobruchus maculatus]
MGLKEIAVDSALISGCDSQKSTQNAKHIGSVCY